jgi:hypothetical protein
MPVPGFSEKGINGISIRKSQNIFNCSFFLSTQGRSEKIFFNGSDLTLISCSHAGYFESYGPPRYSYGARRFGKTFAPFLLFCFLVYFPTLKLEAIYFSKTSTSLLNSRHYKPEDRNLRFLSVKTIFRYPSQVENNHEAPPRHGFGHGRVSMACKCPTYAPVH